MDFSAGTVFTYAIITIIILLIVFAIVGLYLVFSIINRIGSAVNNYVTDFTENISTITSTPSGVLDFTSCACGAPNLLECILSFIPS